MFVPEEEMEWNWEFMGNNLQKKEHL